MVVLLVGTVVVAVMAVVVVVVVAVVVGFGVVGCGVVGSGVGTSTVLAAVVVFEVVDDVVELVEAVGEDGLERLLPSLGLLRVCLGLRTSLFVFLFTNG